MGFGSSSNSEAIKLQKRSLALQEETAAQTTALLKTQIENAKTLKLPKPAAPAALPTLATSDAVAQSRENQKNLRSRMGLNQTRIVNNPILGAFGSYIPGQQ